MVLHLKRVTVWSSPLVLWVRVEDLLRESYGFDLKLRNATRLDLPPDLLRVDSSADHCWSSNVVSFSCPSCAVAGSSPNSTSSSEDMTLSAEGRYSTNSLCTVMLGRPQSSSPSPAGERDTQAEVHEDLLAQRVRGQGDNVQVPVGRCTRMSLWLFL